MATYIDQRLITLSSDNAILNNGSFLSDVNFTFVGLLKDDKDIEMIEISVQNAQIPISFYNINVYNNILIITYDSIQYTLTLTRGNYNSTTLINEITTKLSAQGITDITISISSITGNLTFTRAGSLDFTIDSIGTINKVLGFLENTNYTSVSGILIPPNPLNLLGLLKVKLVSFELLTNNYDSSVDGNLNVLATIPIEAGSFGLILYDNISNTQSILRNNTLDGFDLKLYGDDNNLINFNGIGWNISLLLSITRVKKEISKTSFKDVINPILQLTQNLIDSNTKEKTPNPENTEETENIEEIIQPDFEDLGDSSLDLLLYNNRVYL